jgi:glycosyltransferase involved in cell wall biosynthesis
VHVSDAFAPRMGGIERQVHDLARRQQAAGHDVEIITAVAGGSMDDPPGLVVHRPASSSGKGPGTILYRSWRRGRTITRTGGYDVVHVHSSTWSPMGGMTIAPVARAGLPVVVTVHSLWNVYWPLYSAANWLFGWNRRPIVWSAVSSVATVAVTKQLRTGGPGKLSRRGRRRRADGAGRHPVVDVLPNAVDHDAWRIDPLPRGPKRVVVVSVMRLALRKRPHHYVKMLRQARALVPADIRLEAIIIGDGPRRGGLERYLAKHDMTDWVTLYGRASHEQIREVYRDADFFVAPATLESFGIAALEARSAGLPVIAHAKSGVRDFVEHGREGLLAKGDADMTEQIARLAMTPALLAAMTKYSRDNVPPFGWSEVLERCDELYRRAGVPRAGQKADATPDELAQRRA